MISNYFNPLIKSLGCYINEKIIDRLSPEQRRVAVIALIAISAIGTIYYFICQHRRQKQIKNIGLSANLVVEGKKVVVDQSVVNQQEVLVRSFDSLSTEELQMEQDEFQKSVVSASVQTGIPTKHDEEPKKCFPPKEEIIKSLQVLKGEKLLTDSLITRVAIYFAECDFPTNDSDLLDMQIKLVLERGKGGKGGLPEGNYGQFRAQIAKVLQDCVAR